MSDNGASPGDKLCDSECLDLLTSERRRTLLDHLVDDARTHSLGSLATAVAGTERDADGQPPTEQVRISLHHAHLPKLEAAGVVDYDSQERTVEYLGSPRLEQWLDRLDE